MPDGPQTLSARVHAAVQPCDPDAIRLHEHGGEMTSGHVFEAAGDGCFVRRGHPPACHE